MHRVQGHYFIETLTAISKHHACDVLYNVDA